MQTLWQGKKQNMLEKTAHDDSGALSTDNEVYLYGQSDLSDIHPEVAEPLHALQEKAQQAGFDLRVASDFRHFDRQLMIWNKKAQGEIPVLDSEGKAIDISSLSNKELLFTLLRWSALPGASRHHWGTDIDVYDHKALPDGYQLQLTPDEVSDEGIFGSFHLWLDDQIKNGTACGFFRPYDEDRGGIAPERWHLSFAPLAKQLQQAFSLKELSKILNETNIELKDEILTNLEEVFTRFIDVPLSLYP